MENFGSKPLDPDSTSEDDHEITSSVNPEKTATINVGKAPAEDAKPPRGRSRAKQRQVPPQKGCGRSKNTSHGAEVMEALDNFVSAVWVSAWFGRFGRAGFDSV